jgi:hypothetical protein
MSTELVTLNLEQLPSTQVGTDTQFADLTKGGDFIGRLQLYTKGEAVNKGLIPPGHYGIPVSAEEVEDLGVTVDVVPLARRQKALDMSDKDAIINSYDSEEPEFKRIAAASTSSDSHCMYGVSFLVYERSTGRFLEFFCGSKSTRPEAKKLFPFLPLSAADVEARKLDEEPHGPRPATLKVNLAKNKKGSWHVPVVGKCSTPFNKLPPVERVVKEINDFLTFKGDGVEKVAEETGGKKKRAR